MDRRREVCVNFVSGRDEWNRTPSMLRLIHRDCVLGDDVTGLRFELSVKYSVTKVELLVTVGK